MGTYKEIFGKYVKNLSSDPAIGVSEGQIWYNTTTGTFKSTLNVTAWASGGDLNSARTNGCSGGLQTAALYAGGGSPGAVTELYNGTAWTTSPATMNTARFNMRGAGTQTSYIMTGGDPDNEAESFNGSAWSSETVYPASVSLIGACGTDAASVFFGGGTPITSTTYWNGSAWSAQGGTNQGGAANNGPLGGGQTDAVFLSGTSLGSPAVIGRTQKWNGTSWSTSGTASTSGDGRSNMGIASTLCVAAGGRTSPTGYSTASEVYNGTSWSTTASLASPKAAGGGAGSGTAGLAFGGNSSGSPDVTAKTEELTTAAVARTLTSS